MTLTDQSGDTLGILFYDGECGLCTRSVRFFMRADSGRHLKFAPLQGESASERLPGDLREVDCLRTVVYLRHDQNEPLIRSEAVAQALIDCGGFWAWAGRGIRLFPLSLREWVYRFIARHRLKIFPKGGCALPTAEERERLLP